MDKELVLAHKKNLPFQVILASASPRRRDLLLQLGLDFDIKIPAIEEKRLDREAPAAYVRRNSKEKAMAILESLDFSHLTKPPLIISADTVVTLDDLILEKPGSVEHAQEMLQSLSGRAHQVISAFCLVLPEANQEPLIYNEVVRTKVEFRVLSSDDIQSYIATGESFDKAGAYGIQGFANVFVRKIEGSYTNVVGLPMTQLWEAIQDLSQQKSQLSN
ncbi:MAG: Maf family protein [Oligoflexus sp.]